MSYQRIRRSITVGFLIVAIALAYPRTTRASDEITAGFDLFDPLPGSLIYVPGLGLIPVVGVTLTSFQEFPGVNLGNTNAIMERLGKLSDRPPTPVLETPVDMRAMQLMSTDGSDLFFTLQTGSPSLGIMDIFFGPEPHATGTYTLDFDLFFDVRTGSLGGPILTSFDMGLTTGPSPWLHTAPLGAVLIPGINFQLNGVDDSGDFFPTGVFTGTGSHGTSILFRTAVPEPMTAILLIAALPGFAVVMRIRRCRAVREAQAR